MNKILGVEKPDLSVRNTDYVNFTLVDYDVKDLNSNYTKWLKDTSYFKNYDKITLLREGDIIVRLYRYERESKLVGGLNGEKLVQTKIIPVCKVIKSNSPQVSPGDILYAPDTIAEIATNPTWLQWNKIMTDSRPIPEGLPEPDKLTGLILDWRKGYGLTLDKLNPTMDDQYTFLLPYTQFRALVKP